MARRRLLHLRDRGDGELPAEARVIFDPDLTSVYWPLEKGRCRWGFQIRDAAAHAASMGGSSS